MKKKTDALRRFFLPCITSKTTTTITTNTPPTTKKRLSTSLRDDLPHHTENQEEEQEEESEDSANSQESVRSIVPPRSSRSMVIGTLFGPRRGHHSFFCIQHDRLTTKPCFFLQFSVPTHLLVKEMQCGLLRIALESRVSDTSSCSLSSVPLWTMCVNGRKVGFASRRRASEKDRLMLKSMQSMTVGAGVIPSSGEGELVYMRANYERVVGSFDSESFHLINPDGPGQEFSVFLLRSG